MAQPNTTLEELRKGVSRPAGASHELVIKRIGATFLELDGVGFYHDSAVLLPQLPVAAKGDSAASDSKPRTAPLTALRHVIDFAAANPGQKLLIVGHADTSGAASYNLSLTDLRAKNVHALLVGDRTGWAGLCMKRYRIADMQSILSWAAREHQFGCDPGTIDNKAGPKTTAALKRFRRRYNAELGGHLSLDGALCTADWKAFFDLYEISLSRELGVEEAKLSSKRSALKLMTPPTLACGEHWPISSVGIDGLKASSNRRVDFVFFEEQGFQPLDKQDPPGRDLYGTDLRFRRKVAEVDYDLTIQLVDEMGMPAKEVAVLVRKLPDGEVETRTADGNGVVRIQGQPGDTYEVIQLADGQKYTLLSA